LISGASKYFIGTAGSLLMALYRELFGFKSYLSLEDFLKKHGLMIDNKPKIRNESV
jgi:hypothetical protein